MKRLDKWMLILISVSVVLLALEMWPKNIKLVSDDGNFLFYNSPAVDSDGEQEFIAYLKKSGKVVVKSLNKSDTQSEILIHDYSGLIKLVDRKGEAADDHAAPSIIFNKDTKELLIATAYHGSDLYIYML